MHPPSPAPVEALPDATWLKPADPEIRMIPDYLIDHDSERRIADFTRRMLAGSMAQREVVAIRRVLALVIRQHGPIRIPSSAALPADAELSIRVDDRGGFEIDVA